MTDLPIVCTLTQAGFRARRDDLLGHLLQRADDRQDLAEGYRVRFSSTDDMLPAIARTVDVERQCCRFLRFQVIVEPDGGPIWLDLTGPAGTREFLAAMFDL